MQKLNYFVQNIFSAKSDCMLKDTKPKSQSSESRQPLNILEKLLNFSCKLCGCILLEMAAIPQGMFAAMKVRENMQKSPKVEQKMIKDNTYVKQYCTELNPMKYNSKLMNSIWGMYNRYSVHNFKKNIDQTVNTVQAWNQQA